MKYDILIGGDLVPYGEVESFFVSGDVETVLGTELFDIWNKAEHRFFNLECPLTDSNDKIVKCGPHLKCTPKAINGIKKLSPSCVFLSNNHIMDYSASGLNDTMELLNKNKIEWTGTGLSIDTLKKTYVFDCRGRKIGIYNCCEHEFSTISEETPGANPYDEFSIDDNLATLKTKCDFVIVVYHGGKEYYRYPSPELQKRCRKMVSCGADLVLCQHSHCIGCEEKFKNGTIVYGQGNFVFNMQQNEFWNTSLVIGLNITNDGVGLAYIPIIQSEHGTRLATTKEAKRIMSDYKKRSKRIKADGFVQDEYRKYADEKLGFYFVALRKSYLVRFLRKFFPRFLTKHLFDCKTVLNVIECEAHRELFIQGLKNAIAKEKNN